MGQYISLTMIVGSITEHEKNKKNNATLESVYFNLLSTHRPVLCESCNRYQPSSLKLLVSTMTTKVA